MNIKSIDYEPDCQKEWYFITNDIDYVIRPPAVTFLPVKVRIVAKLSYKFFFG